MQKIYRVVLLLILILPFSYIAKGSLPQDKPSYVTIKNSTLTRDSILIGDQVVWETLFTLPSNRSLTVLPYSETIAKDSTKIEALSEFVIDTVALKDGVAELKAKVIITSFDSGSFSIPSPIFVISGGDTLKLESKSLAVNTIQIDTATFEMYDIKGQMSYPITFKEIAPWALILLVVALGIYLIYRYIKYKRENKTFFGKPIVQDPPHIIALRELDKLRTQKAWQNGKEKAFYTGVTDTIRGYIEARYKFNAMEKTSAEIMSALESEKIEARPYNELNELFQLADLVKFAKYTPQESDNEEAIPAAVRFVNATFMQEMEQESVKVQKDEKVEPKNKEE